MAIQEFSLPDELFQEVLVSKFSEEHVEKTEPDTGMMPFAPIRANQLMRIANVSKVFFGTSEAKKFLKISYNYIKDVLFSRQETEKKWEHFRNMYAKKLYNERETKRRADKKGYENTFMSIIIKIQTFGRILSIIQNSIKIYKKIIEHDYTIKNIDEPKDTMSAIHNEFEKAYKLFYTQYLNISTDFMALFFTDILKTLGTGILNHIIKESILGKIKNKIKTYIDNSIKKYIKKKLKKNAAKIIGKFVLKALIHAAINAGAAVATGGLSLAATLAFSASLLYADMREVMQDISKGVNKIIDTQISQNLRNGISTLRQLEDKTRGFKSPEEKITSIYETVLESEEEISLSRIFRKTTQTDEQRFVAVINTLLSNLYKGLFSNDVLPFVSQINGYIENDIISKDEKLLKIWNFSKTNVFNNQEEYIANSRFVNYMTSSYKEFSKKSEVNPGIRKIETNEHLKEFNQRLELFSNKSMIDVDKRANAVIDIYESIQDFHVARIIDSHTTNLIKRKLVFKKIKEMGEVLLSFESKPQQQQLPQQ